MRIEYAEGQRMNWASVTWEKKCPGMRAYHLVLLPEGINLLSRFADKPL